LKQVTIDKEAESKPANRMITRKQKKRITGKSSSGCQTAIQVQAAAQDSQHQIVLPGSLAPGRVAVFFADFLFGEKKRKSGGGRGAAPAKLVLVF